VANAVTFLKGVVMALTDDIERRVRALLERANHPGTPQAEAESALAIAYRLMMKYDLDEQDITSTADPANPNHEIEHRRYETTGPYRVRRNALRYRILSSCSCASYRDFTEGDTSVVIGHAFGTAADLDAAEIIYAAAEMLALRVIPWGDRGFRTSWWHGFTDGIAEKLDKERKTVVREFPGAGLVLRDRAERASIEMDRVAPNLVSGGRSGISWESAYDEGRRAGSSFTSGGRTVGGAGRALPRGT
jgi:hypothetical protein